MSAFPESGRSGTTKTAEIRVRLRPQAVIGVSALFYYCPLHGVCPDRPGCTDVPPQQMEDTGRMTCIASTLMSY